MSETNPKRDLALRYYFRPDSPTCGNITKTSEKTSCSPNAVTRWIKSEAGRTFQAELQAELRVSSYISIEKIQAKLYDIAQKATEARQYHAAISAYTTLLKTVGGFVADRLPPENLAGKALDAQRAADMRAIADAYYAQRYLAQPAAKTIETTEQTEKSPQARAATPQAATP